MRVSGKKTIILMFAVSLALCLWIRAIAPKLTGNPQSPKLEQGKKPRRGYRTKNFPTMEEARAVADKKINSDPQQKNIITKYKSFDDGWIFEYESEKYLNSAKQKDKLINNPPVFVNKDGEAEFFTGEKNK